MRSSAFPKKTASAGDPARLPAALRAILSPFDFPSADAWRAAVLTELCALLGADNGSFLLPRRTGPSWVTLRPTAGDHADPAQYALHDTATERMARLGLTVAHGWQLMTREEVERPAFQAHLATYRLHDAVGLRVQVGPGQWAGVCLHHDESLGPDGRDYDAMLALLQTVVPAFEAGVATWMRQDRARASIARALDALPAPVLVCDDAGAPVHANAALARLFEDEPEGQLLRRELDSLAYQVAGVLRRGPVTPGQPVGAARAVRTSGSRYALRASVVGEDIIGPRPGILLVIEVESAAPMSDEVLRQRFALTPREIGVARLLAEGLSNREIAERLGIRPYTARNHVERVLHKLDVPSRARVAALLRAPAPAAHAGDEPAATVGARRGLLVSSGGQQRTAPVVTRRWQDRGVAATVGR